MFKFLKDKIKKAVEKLKNVSESDVIEEPADAAAIEAAKREEAEQHATELPDTEEAIEHRERHEKEKATKKPKKTPKKPSIKPLKEKTPEETPQASAQDVVGAKEEAPETQAPVEKPEEPVEEVLEEPVIEDTEEPVSTPERVEEPKKSFLKKVFGKKEPITEPAKTDSVSIETSQPEEKTPDEPKPEPKSFMGKFSENFTKKRLTEEKFEELFWDLELSLLENNVAVEVIEKIKHDMKEDLTTGKVTRKGIQQLITDSLRDSIEDLFVEPFDLVEHIQRSEKRPFIITVIGVNGSGKTTTLAKIANLFQENNLRVVLAASDTFRAAAIDQLKEHANKLGIKLISQGYNADPAAVAFDAIKHAEAQHIDVVLIDTAGRLHSNTNLMAELEKVVRVAKPDLKLFVGESITGNDCVEQAEEFNKAVGIDAIILSKADVDEKGGAAISVSYVTGKPILYLGVGQAYGDLRPFDAERIVSSLGLS